MKTASFAVNLTSRPLDETSLDWVHPVRITAARALLIGDLTGSAPAWIHVAGGGRIASFLFGPPCGDGSRRVANVLEQQPLELAAGEKLKVWGIRDGGGGVFRVELDYVRPSRREKPRPARQDDRIARERAGVGTW
jgi:hypothetical protein